MPIIKTEHIAGYFGDNEQIICGDCVTDASDNLTSDEVITRDLIESTEDLWFCDICKQKFD